MSLAQRVLSVVALVSAGCPNPAGTADSDSDSDSDTDSVPLTDTFTESGDPASGPLGMIAYPGDGVFIAGRYVGAQHAGVYVIDDPLYPDLWDTTAVCQFSWHATDAASAPSPVADLPDIARTPCPACEFTVVLVFHGGTETGPAGGCRAYGIDAATLKASAFGYGYTPDYIDPLGVTFGPSVMAYFEAQPTLDPPRPATWMEVGPATWDPATGAFSYMHVAALGYLN